MNNFEVKYTPEADMLSITDYSKTPNSFWTILNAKSSYQKNQKRFMKQIMEKGNGFTEDDIAQILNDPNLRLINGEMWRRADPTAVTLEKKPYFPKPEYGGIFYYITAWGTVDWYYWSNDIANKYSYRTLNCWLDKSELEAYIKRYGKYLPDRLTLAIRRWKIANAVEDRFEWSSNDRPKYCIGYNHATKNAEIFASFTWQYCAVEYFSTEETARKCLTDLHEYFDDQLNEQIVITSGDTKREEK